MLEFVRLLAEQGMPPTGRKILVFLIAAFGWGVALEVGERIEARKEARSGRKSQAEQ